MLTKVYHRESRRTGKARGRWSCENVAMEIGGIIKKGKKHPLLKRWGGRKHQGGGARGGCPGKISTGLRRPLKSQTCLAEIVQKTDSLAGNTSSAGRKSRPFAFI